MALAYGFGSVRGKDHEARIVGRPLDISVSAANCTGLVRITGVNLNCGGNPSRYHFDFGRVVFPKVEGKAPLRHSGHEPEAPTDP